MDRNNTELALANILEVVPFIENIGDNADGPLNRALVRIYERNVAALQANAAAINRAAQGAAVLNVHVHPSNVD